MEWLVLLHQLLQARWSKWLVLLTANTGRRSLDRSQARVRSVVGTSLGRLNCKSLFAGSLLGSSTCSIGPASGLFRGSVATLQAARDRLAGCSSWPLRFAV